MRFRLPTILLTVFVLYSLVSCSKGPRVIPRKTLAEIYAEMFVMDEWTEDNRYRINRLADTSFVYEPILEKYGYDSEDYMASVEKYLADPERFSRILRETENQLNGRVTELKAEKKRQDDIRRLLRKRDSITNVWSISLDSMNTAYVVTVPDKDTVKFSLLIDSLCVAVDSLSSGRDSLCIPEQTVEEPLGHISVRDLHRHIALELK